MDSRIFGVFFWFFGLNGRRERSRMEERWEFGVVEWGN